MATSIRRILIAASLLCVSVPVWAQRGKQASAPPAAEAPSAPAGGPDLARQPDPKTYVLGINDIIHIEVFKEPDYSRTVGVRPDGMITMPQIGDVKADGITPERLGAHLTEALTELINHPEVTVSLVTINSKMYSVTGRVNRPSQYPLAAPIRIVDALTIAGGLSEWGNDKEIRILRNNGKEILKFNYRDYLKGKPKAIEQNIFLQPGDIVNVK